MSAIDYFVERAAVVYAKHGVSEKLFSLKDGEDVGKSEKGRTSNNGCFLIRFYCQKQYSTDSLHPRRRQEA